MPIAHAHKASDSYLTLKVAAARIDGRWDIALRDLDFALGLDRNDNGEITWGEVRSRREAVFGYALNRLALVSGRQPCPMQPADYLIDRHTDGAYAVLIFSATCGTAPSQLEVAYRLFFDLDPQHRGLLRVEYGSISHAAVLSPSRNNQTFALTEQRLGAAFRQYLLEGARHIWAGYDHILFLLSLLLPAVLIRKQQNWLPAEQLRSVIVEVVKIVTAFTVAHSLTLTLATLGLIDLPSRWVESAIAASVAFAALNNLYPFLKRKVWLAAFAFGLIHGLGFANVLKALGLPDNLLLLTLFAFNLGVEAGQLAIVSVFLPIAFYLRHGWFYRRVILHTGSIAITAIAVIWCIERATNFRLIDWEGWTP